MEINFKHNLGDVVYIYQEQRIFKVVIKEIDIKVTSEGFGYTYNVVCENLDNDCLLKYHWFEDEEVFSNLDELFKNIEVL